MRCKDINIFQIQAPRMKIFAQSQSPRVHLHFQLCRQSLRLRSQFSARNPYEVSSPENFRSVLGIGNTARVCKYCVHLFWINSGKTSCAPPFSLARATGKLHGYSYRILARHYLHYKSHFYQNPDNKHGDYETLELITNTYHENPNQTLEDMPSHPLE